MRSSISCDACRRSKVRCLNTGNPPCRRCFKSGIEGCTLVKPGAATSRARTRQTRQTLRQSTPERPAAGLSPPIVERSVDEHLANLPNNLILKSLSVFLNKVPELAFVHIPRFMEDWNSSHKEEMKTLLATILAFIKDHLVILNLEWHKELLSVEQYLSYARGNLLQMTLEPPRIQVVQGLLVLSLYEWGSQGYHRPWMYCGFATRVMQALHSTRVAPHATDHTATFKGDTVLLAIETRTFWACFVMDCMINCGTYNPRVLTMSEMHALKVGPPLSAVDFAFGPDLSPSSGDHNYDVPTGGGGVFDVAQAFEVLVSGFDIWVQVMAFIFNDGRRAPGMCAPKNCPWAQESPWSKIRQRLEYWRVSQHHRLQYPKNSVSAHMALGYAESFTYINLLYYLSTMMLHREYFPFLPINESQPRGPVDAPFLEDEAPDDWWSHSANELFGAARNITSLLNEASECEVPLLTPFAGFCGFSAAFINTYIYHFPAMNFGRSVESAKLVQWSLDYLETFSRVWKLGDAWLKTVNNASLLYGRANRNQTRYFGKSRKDFSVLHQSVHEFRVIDRSDQQLRELEEAEQSGAEPNLRLQAIPMTLPSGNEGDEVSIDRLFAEMRGSWDEDGVWSHWWTSQEGHDFGLLPPQSPE